LVFCSEDKPIDNSADESEILSGEITYVNTSTFTTLMLLPNDEEIPGWTKSNASLFCETDAQLFAVINGEGIIYMNNNFKEAVFQEYIGIINSNPVYCEVRIFDMRNEDNAEIVYDSVSIAGDSAWTAHHPGVEARINYGLLFDYQIDFREERFFTRIIIQQKSPEGLDICKRFAWNLYSAMLE
jgi:hypothetical protein